MIYPFKLAHQLPKCYLKSWPMALITLFICTFLHIFIMGEILQLLKNISSMITLTDPNEEILPPKYILTWDRYHLIIKRTGRSIFLGLNCSVSNCIFTQNRGLLNDYTEFDAIIFNHFHLNIKEGRPTRRTNSQIYIFSTIESAANLPACELYNDGFFNWTFTHRLDSDVVWNYFVVRNITGDIVAPSKTVKWARINNFISPSVRSILQGRTKVAAWIVSNCVADSLRDEYISRLQDHLYLYSIRIDVYGHCTGRKCENNDCNKMLRNNYYFYMAFENSFSEDYVTEKVLHAYKNYLVPIVFGGANYSRFLPPDSYINARELHPYNLAFIMHRAMTEPKLYETYFKWTNFYTIDSNPQSYHPLCDLCKALNSERPNVPAKKDFRIWWNRLSGMKWCLPWEYWNETGRVNLDGSYIYNNLY